ncbi:hypothetical protein [Dokdonella ginsengisoli]
MGVSGQTVHAASKVIEKAVPEIIEKCKSGEMALNEAKRVIDLNPAAQRRIAELPKGQPRSRGGKFSAIDHWG